VNERARLLADLAATAVCATAAILILAGLSTPARPFAVLGGLVLGTGWSLAGWIKLPNDAAYVTAVTLAIGVAIPMGAGVILVESSWWHPLGDAAALLCGAGVLNLLQCLKDFRRAAQA
jgi:hypothetical protein